VKLFTIRSGSSIMNARPDNSEITQPGLDGSGWLAAVSNDLPALPGRR